MASKPDLDTKWLAQLLKQRHHDEKPVKVLEVNTEAAVPKGENYSSTVVRIKTRALTANGANKNISLIAKLSKISTTKGSGGFKAETKLFNTIFKQMEALMEEFEDKRDRLWPKWYGAIPYHTLVMEDLKDSGYVLVDRTSWHGLDHSMLVLRSMARLHAMTKVLLVRGLITDDDKGHHFTGPNSPAKKALAEGGFHMTIKSMTNQLGAWPAGWEELANRLDKQKPLICDKMSDLFQNYDKKFEVLCHGDMWSSNMMFKFMEYTGIPISVKFIDYQIPHINSFIWDVIHYMHTSVKPSVRRAHKSELLKAYHQSFADNLRFFSYPGYVPSLEDIISEEQRLAPAALFFLLCIMPIASATSKEALVLEKLGSGKPEEYLDIDAFCEEKFVREIGDDLKDFAKASII